MYDMMKHEINAYVIWMKLNLYFITGMVDRCQVVDCDEIEFSIWCGMFEGGDVRVMHFMMGFTLI